MTTIFCLLASVYSTPPPVEFPLEVSAPATTNELTLEPAAFAPSTRAPLVQDQERPEMEYTYIEANYITRDVDLIDDTIDGWELTGSLELPLNFFLQGTVNDQSGDADFSTYRVGAGWHFGFTSLLDAYGILSYEHLEIEGSGNDISEDGASGELGLRFLLTPKIELNGRALWADVDDDEAGGGVGARFYFSESLSIGARYDILDDDEFISAGLRFEF